MSIEIPDKANPFRWIKRVDQRFLKNVSYLGISNIVYAASQWGIILLVTKLSTIENVARLSLGLAIVTPIMLFLGAGLKTFISIDVQKKNSFGDYFAVRLFTSLIGFVIVLLLGMIGGYSRDTFIVIGLIAVVKIIEAIQEVCWGINQRVELMDPIGISRLLRSITCLSAIALGLWMTKDLVIGILLWMSLWLAILIFYDFPRARQIEPIIYKLNIKQQKKILLQIFPLALIAGLVALNDKATQYQIAGLLGESAVGYYSPLAYVIQGVGLGVVSIAETMTPRLALFYQQNRKEYVRATLALAGISAFIGVFMLVVFGSLRSVLLPLLYTKDFLAYSDLFLLLLGMSIFRFAQTGLGVAVTATGRFYNQTPMLVCSLLILGLSGWYFMPRYGLNGAGYSVGLSTIFLFFSFLYLWFMSISRDR